MSQPSASPSLIVHSIAVRFGAGSVPGCARQTGHVCVFSGSPKDVSQRQNIFVRVFRWMWISRPTTGSHSATEHLLRLAYGLLDVASHLDHREPLLERCRVHANEPQLSLARLEAQLHVVDEHGSASVEDAHR